MDNELLTKLTKMGYLIHNKRVIGNPSFTSESTRNRNYYSLNEAYVYGINYVLDKLNDELKTITNEQ